MFNIFKRKTEEDSIEAVKEFAESVAKEWTSILNGQSHYGVENNKVKCETCKCWLDKEDAQEIRNYMTGYLGYYCQVHKKNYDRYELGYRDGYTDKCLRYFKELEVDEKGEPVGYTKNKTK